MSNRSLRILYTGDTFGTRSLNKILNNHLDPVSDLEVNDTSELEAALNNFNADVIVAAYTEINFLTVDLLAYLIHVHCKVPLLLVVPVELEDFALTLLDNGIADYLTANNLKRLPHAVKNLAKRYQLEQQQDIRYRYLFDQNLAGLYTSSVKGEILECNTALANMLGYNSPAELIGRPAVDLYLVAAHRNDFLNDLRKHRKLYNYESVLVRKDGSAGYLLENLYLTSDPVTGEEICQGVMIDVTQLVKTKQNIIRARTMLTEAQNLARMGNWNYNLRKKELTASVGLKEICSLDADSKLNLAEIFNLIHPNDLDRVIEGIKNLNMNGGRIENQFTIIRADKVEIKVHAVYTLDFDEQGKVIRYYGVIQDVTDIEKAEKERNRITEELIKRNKALEQFTYVISHNLRAPVANIRSLTDILMESETSSVNKDLIEKMHLTVGNLDSVISDLNQILQVKQQQQIQKEEVNLHALMSSIHLSIKNLIVQENVKIVIDIKNSFSVTAIRGYLYSIFYNLTLNSIKYRKLETDPVIRITCGEENEALLIKFEDNSKGIDLEKNGNDLFGLYKRFDQSVEGKGMGLYMVKAQVEELGGSINVASKLGVGTRFTIKLPNQLN